MSEKSPRRPLQFSLRNLFMVVTALGLLLGSELAGIHERRWVANWVVAEGGAIGNGPEAENQAKFAERVVTYHRSKRIPIQLPYWRRWLGDVAVTNIRLPDATTEAELDRVMAAFPYAEILYNGEVFQGSLRPKQGRR